MVAGLGLAPPKAPGYHRYRSDGNRLLRRCLYPKPSQDKKVVYTVYGVFINFLLFHYNLLGVFIGGPVSVGFGAAQ